MARHRLILALVLATVACTPTAARNDEASSRHPSFATTTAIEHQLSGNAETTTAAAPSNTAALSTIPLIGPASTRPDESPEVVDLPDGIDDSLLGLHGQIRATAFGPNGDYGWGLSYYSGIWGHFNGRPPAEVLSVNGTSLIPDNWRYSQTLCPEGTSARASLSGHGPSYREVFQAIEGTVGYWPQTRFPSSQPKFRMGGNTDCYTTNTSNPGWVWRSDNEVIPGLIQLSNRVLVPPDGITFEATDGELLGTAWMALPLSQPYERSGVVVGDKSWTLFLEAENFRGPVAYWAPEAWSRVTINHPPAHLRGLDHREIDTEYRLFASHLNTPSLSAVVEGKDWSRIPELRFPVDSEGRTVFHQDVTFYGRDAVYDQVVATASGAPLPNTFDNSASIHAPLQTHRWELQHGELPIIGLEKFVQLDDWDTADKEGWAWGLQWLEQPGVFPSYFRREGSEWLAVDRSDSPSEMTSTDLVFPGAIRRSGYAPPLADGPAPRVQQALLNDGSVVRYTWYRFVEQPAVVALDLDDAQKAGLQSLVEQIHRQWGPNAIFMMPPSEGDLARIQTEVIVAPPTGAEVGWVPVVISQTAAK